MAERTGIEPATSCVTGRHSNRLNYRSASYGMPGNDLLSRKRTLHYHRRVCISLLCSEWLQVVLQSYRHRANSLTSLKLPYSLMPFQGSS